MGLGELYKPSGLAFETARAVLEVEDPYAVNVALGCPNGCLYCYGPSATRQSRENYHNFRLPKKVPMELIDKQLEKGLKPNGVFISFLTDPFLPTVRVYTNDVVSNMNEIGIRTATLSKLDVSYHPENRSGMTVVSPYEDFSMKYEPNVKSPWDRLYKLWEASDEGVYTWLSMEPWPCQDIFESNLFDIIDFFDKLKWVDLLIFGKWNYDKRAKTDKARREYQTIVEVFESFCLKNKIRYHIKSDTLKFIGRKSLQGETK